MDRSELCVPVRSGAKVGKSITSVCFKLRSEPFAAHERSCIFTGSLFRAGAQRLGIVRNCDRIAVVEDGELTRVGDWEDMIQNSEYFSKVWNDYNSARFIRYSLKAGETL